MDVNFLGILIHVGTSLISAGIVAIAAFMKIQGATRSNTRRIARLESWDAWYRLVLTQLATLHNVNHPDRPITIPDVPEIPYNHRS
jgi:hypothetical protein